MSGAGHEGDFVDHTPDEPQEGALIGHGSRHDTVESLKAEDERAAAMGGDRDLSEQEKLNAYQIDRAFRFLYETLSAAGFASDGVCVTVTQKDKAAIARLLTNGRGPVSRSSINYSAMVWANVMLVGDKDHLGTNMGFIADSRVSFGDWVAVYVEENLNNEGAV